MVTPDGETLHVAVVLYAVMVLSGVTAPPGLYQAVPIVPGTVAVAVMLRLVAVMRVVPAAVVREVADSFRTACTVAAGGERPGVPVARVVPGPRGHCVWFVM